MSVHLYEVTFEAGISLNPNFRQGTGSRDDLLAIATRLMTALDRAYLGRSPRAVLLDHVDQIRVAKITGRRVGRAVTVRAARRERSAGRKRASTKKK